MVYGAATRAFRECDRLVDCSHSTASYPYCYRSRNWTGYSCWTSVATSAGGCAIVGARHSSCYVTMPASYVVWSCASIASSLLSAALPRQPSALLALLDARCSSKGGCPQLADPFESGYHDADLQRRRQSICLRQDHQAKTGHHHILGTFLGFAESLDRSLSLQTKENHTSTEI